MARRPSKHKNSSQTHPRHALFHFLFHARPQDTNPVCRFCLQLTKIDIKQVLPDKPALYVHNISFIDERRSRHRTSIGSTSCIFDKWITRRRFCSHKNPSSTTTSFTKCLICFFSKCLNNRSIRRTRARGSAQTSPRWRLWPRGRPHWGLWQKRTRPSRRARRRKF